MGNCEGIEKDLPPGQPEQAAVKEAKYSVKHGTEQIH
jgi:hypothetical protein